jgi:hypothetical protein
VGSNHGKGTKSVVKTKRDLERTERIAIRVDKKFLAKIEELAKKDNGRPVSTYARIVLEQHVKNAA